MVRPTLVVSMLALSAFACDKGQQATTSPSAQHSCAEVKACCAKVGDPGVKKQCLAAQEKAQPDDNECAPLYAAYCH